MIEQLVLYQSIILDVDLNWFYILDNYIFRKLDKNV